MSVITNKDRINENNDRINRLIELIKKKALSSNPKYATTEAEMDDLLTDKNIGKVVKYLGALVETPSVGGKYEKNALYIIAEGEREVIENPTVIGDEVTQIYFDTTKTTEEVVEMLTGLDWDNPDYHNIEEGIKYITLFGKAKTEFVNGVSSNESSSSGLYLCIDAMKAEINMGDRLVTSYQLAGPFGDGVLFAYFNSGEPVDWELDHYGWQTTSPLTSVNPFTIGYVRDKEIWGSWLSTHENGFTSIGEPTTPRARRLNITEGSLTITENGTYDVSNLKTVKINVAGSGSGNSLTATTEEELNALDTPENVGKIVSYNNGLYIVTED